ncbi:retrovirus-related pol polyprotein from transposon TNT 1-94 [Tanacetum coccineum]
MSTSKTYQQSLADAGSETRPPMLERGSYIPWASRFKRFLNRKRENRKWLLKALEDGPYVFRNITPTGSTIPRLQEVEDLQGDDLLYYDAEMELMNMILLSIPNEIYNSVDSCKTAKEMWARVERLMRGTIQNQVDRETRFTNEFDQFVAEPGESLVSVYNRFAQLMNDLERNNMKFPTVSVNTKFLNSLQPEWLKYVTQVRLAKQLTVDSFDDLFDYLSQFEKLVNASRAKKLEKSHDPLALVAHTGSSSRNTSSYYVTHPSSVVDYDEEYEQDDVHNHSEDPLASAMLLLAKAITQNFSNPTNNRLRASSNTRNQAVVQGDRVNIQSRNSGNVGRNNRRAYVQEEVVEGMNATNETANVQRIVRTPTPGNTSTGQCYNCGGKGHYARNCPKPRVRDSKYFMEQMLLAKQDEAGVILTDEQNDFLFADASRMEEIEELSANICLMARIQPADQNSDDEPSYESAFVSEVQSSSINENDEQMYPTHTKIINSTIDDDQINSNIQFDSVKGNVNSGSVEKDTHILIDRLEWSGLELRGQEASDDHPLESQNIHQTSVETAAPNLYWWELEAFEGPDGPVYLKDTRSQVVEQAGMGHLPLALRPFVFLDLITKILAQVSVESEGKSFDTTINSAAQPTHDQEDSPSTSSIIVDTHEAPLLSQHLLTNFPILYQNSSDEFNSRRFADFDGVICPVARREDVQMFIAFVALYEYIFLSNGCQNGFSQWLKKAFTVLSKAPVHDIALLLVYVLVIKRLRSTHQRGPNGSFSVVKLIKNAHQEKLKCFLPLQCVVSDMDKYQMLDMDVKYNRIPMYCESQEHVERGTVEIYFVGTEYQLADLFTKALPKERFEYLVHRIDIWSSTALGQICKIFSKCLTTRGYRMGPTAVADNANVILLYVLEMLSQFFIVDDIMKNIFNLGRNKNKVGMWIPAWMITDEMKLTEHYNMYSEVFGQDVPLTQSQPTESSKGMHRTPSAPRSPNPAIETAESSVPKRSTLSLAEHKSREEQEARENVALVYEHLAVEEIENLVEDPKNVDDSLPPRHDDTSIPGTRLEPMSDKESPEVEIVQEKEERDYKDSEEKMVKWEESRGDRMSPIPTPTRSPRNLSTLVSSDIEKLQELTVTHPRPSSGSSDQRTIWLLICTYSRRSMHGTTSDQLVDILSHEDDPHDDAHPEGENSAKWQKTSEYEAYVSGESSSGQVETSTQDIRKEISLTMDEAKLKKMEDVLLRQRCTSGDGSFFITLIYGDFLASDLFRKECTISIGSKAIKGKNGYVPSKPTSS